jgi:F-type H+-transporting ATPase subunit gamma
VAGDGKVYEQHHMAGLRRKIGSAGDLQSVVRTMKALAASSIGQYEQSVRALA